jgi:ATP-dependent RNA helicase DDX49/DBP8
VSEQPSPTIIFCACPRTAAFLTLLLKTLNIHSTALHSRLTQRECLSSLSLFRASVVPVLVSTDVGARGLDIEDVAMVVNWDMPNEPEEYTAIINTSTFAEVLVSNRIFPSITIHGRVLITRS